MLTKLRPLTYRRLHSDWDTLTTRGGGDVSTNDEPSIVYTFQTCSRLIVILNRATTVPVHHDRDLPQTGVYRRKSPSEPTVQRGTR